MKIAFVILISLLAAPPALPHDLWLIPPEKSKTGEAVVILASSGMDFPKSEQAPDSAKFPARKLVSSDGKPGVVNAAAAEGKFGRLEFTPLAGGFYIVAVETTPKLITLDAEKFNACLVSDGLPQIYALRSAEKSLDQPGRERYSKSPKALLRIGDGETGDPCAVVGLPLEIVPLKNPFERKVGDTLPVKVFFRGKALADANLGWAYPDGGEAPAGTARTNAKGEALIPLSQAGLMTIRLTHMTRPKEKDYEWESFWTTLTFRLP